MKINPNKKNSPGMLYIVATPIGNLADISQRALEILATVDFIAAEDTRHSTALLKQYNIKTPLFALHEHNERLKSQYIIDKLKENQSIALISDAGTPLISDPGFYLVREVRAAGLSVSPIPGPCAAIAALSASGLPSDRFIFEGFLPSKSRLRQARLTALKKETRTLIFYEAPHRILAVLKEMGTIFGSQRTVVMARELTKLYETLYSGSLEEIVPWIEKDANQERGEIVLLVKGEEEQEDADSDGKDTQVEKMLTLLLQSLPLKEAVAITAECLGLRKNEIYKKALNIYNITR